MGETVYLAGPITGKTVDGANSWRERATEYLAQFGIRALTPLRAKEHVEAIVGEGRFEDQYRDAVFGSDHDIYKRDRWDVEHCDLLLVNLTEPATESGLTYQNRELVSVGTVMEIAWADAFGTYSIVAIPAGSRHSNPILRQAAGVVVPDFQEALTLVPVVLGVD